MSEKEYRKKCESMFSKNTVLLNRIEELKKENEQLKKCTHCETCKKMFGDCKWENKND